MFERMDVGRGGKRGWGGLWEKQNKRQRPVLEVVKGKPNDFVCPTPSGACWSPLRKLRELVLLMFPKLLMRVCDCQRATTMINDFERLAGICLGTEAATATGMRACSCRTCQR